MKNSYLDEVSKVDWWDAVATFCRTLIKPVVELASGIRKKNLPLHVLVPISFLIQLGLSRKMDAKLLRLLARVHLSPQGFFRYAFYYALWLSTPFWIWAWSEVAKKERLSRILKETLESIGLKNNLGKLPIYIFDKPIDASTRKLRLSRAAFSLTDFQKAKGGIESGLHIYIDEIRENRIEGSVDLIYSSRPMPEMCRVADYTKIPAPTFVVGATRAKEVKADLNSVPHLLVAGQTGAGKSTFLRQFITTHYLNDKDCSFTLIDLKAGLDSQLFEGLPRVSVFNTPDQANRILCLLPKTIEWRSTVLKSHNCRDISQFSRLPKSKRNLPKPKSEEILAGLNRHIIIVDEAAELFLASEKTRAREAQEARRVLSQVARQGRSLGLHLVLATQRPDSRALDPQIKANLTGVLCFQMVNDISSILVLGNGRATDLPPVPGRAIWKAGLDMVEVQTPYLDDDETKELLKNERSSQPAAKAESAIPQTKPMEANDGSAKSQRD